jgi:hypothetical protein
MQDKFVQAIRYKLQKRVRRLNSAGYHQFPFALRTFFRFFESSPLLAGVRDELMARVVNSDVPTTVDLIANGGVRYGETEEEAAAMGYLLLKKVAEDPESSMMVSVGGIGMDFGSVGRLDERLDMVRSVFLEPFYEYVDEHLDDQQAILYFLRRYKHRCEWFHAERLRQAVRDDTQKGEKTLALDLYEYLHDQGIDFHIEPHSTSGIPDFVADQIGNDRVIADTKLFWPDRSKGKPYILSGFHQAYTYACDYNEPCAFLVIYKLCGETLNFLVPASEASFPCLTVNNKTIFFIVVDICEHGATASKRGPMRSVDITEKELVQSVETRENPREDQSAVQESLP